MGELSETKSKLDMDITMAEHALTRAQMDLDEAVDSYNALVKSWTASFKHNEKSAFIARYKNISKDDMGFQSQSTVTEN